MERRVMLTILGEQTDPDGEVSEMKMITEGMLCRDGDDARLTYREAEPTGMGGAEMTIQLEDGAVRVCREGDYSSNFFFRQGYKCLNLYQTPFGTLELGAYPTKVCYGLREDEGEIHLCYDLDLRGKYLGQNRLTLAWKESPIC